MAVVWLSWHRRVPAPGTIVPSGQLPASGGLGCCRPHLCTSRPPSPPCSLARMGLGPTQPPSSGASTTLHPAVALSPARSPWASSITQAAQPWALHALPPCCPPHRGLLRCHLQGALRTPAPTIRPPVHVQGAPWVNSQHCRPLAAPWHAVSLAGRRGSFSGLLGEPSGCEHHWITGRASADAGRQIWGGYLDPQGPGQGSQTPRRCSWPDL